MFSGCSSLLPPNEDLIKLYNLEKYFAIRSISEVDCEPISDLVGELGIDNIDFLKLDLEGLDFEVIKSLGQLIEGILFIQCELRFQPFYLNEPYFHEVVSYLYAHEFELLLRAFN